MHIGLGLCKKEFCDKRLMTIGQYTKRIGKVFQFKQLQCTTTLYFIVIALLFSDKIS